MRGTAHVLPCTVLLALCVAGKTGNFLPMQFATFSWDRKDKLTVPDTTETNCALSCFLSPRSCSFYSFNQETRDCLMGVDDEFGNSEAMVISPDEPKQTTVHVLGIKIDKGDSFIIKMNCVQ